MMERQQTDLPEPENHTPRPALPRCDVIENRDGRESLCCRRPLTSPPHCDDEVFFLLFCHPDPAREHEETRHSSTIIRKNAFHPTERVVSLADVAAFR